MNFVLSGPTTTSKVVVKLNLSYVRTRIDTDTSNERGMIHTARFAQQSVCLLWPSQEMWEGKEKQGSWFLET